MDKNLKFETRRINNEMTIFDLAGAMNIYNASTLREEFEKQVRLGMKNFIVNLAELATIDSAGIGVLFTILSTVQSMQGVAILLSPNETIRKLFDVTQVSSYFTVMDSEGEAIARIRAA